MSAPHPPRRILPLPVETITKSKRRNAPEACEPITKSNKASPINGEPLEKSYAVKKSFHPTPVETTTRSNRKGVVSEQAPVPETPPIPKPPPVRRLPQPVETTTTSSRRKKIIPQLIETTKRSRKAGDVGLALLPTDKTEIVAGGNKPQLRPSLVPHPGALLVPPNNTPIPSTNKVPQLLDSRFSSASLSRNAARRHSFRVPDLASIESRPDSEESEGSDPPSLSTSPSVASHDTELHKHASRVRESCDERFSGYLLALAAQAAEKQLREQAMAAYPNEALHEPVDHFAIDKESDISDETDEEMGPALLPHERADNQARRKQSTAESEWEIREMQKHPTRKLEVYENQHRPAAHPELARRVSALGPFQRAPHVPKPAGHAADGLDRMRSAASPPMLGGDIEFPICQSPRHTRFEVDQYPCHMRGSGATTPRERSGLWTPGAGTSRHGSGRGLWMGVCAGAENDGLAVPKPGRTGLITPADNEYSSFAPDVMDFETHFPASPPDSLPGPGNMACIDDMLMAEQEIQRECHDAFVTQVYNYLSLGYPAIARKFDDELSKITRVPVDELRRDDKLANTKGYVGTPEGKGVTQDGVSDGQCARWRALKLYIREWARQKPGMAVKPDLDAWGERARRGSWAI
ncbi:hypothetical protein MMC16_001595 [Acarospora aff. strigata]|nr:hypothetical protein [Acarospora aff. strigata]